MNKPHTQKRLLNRGFSLVELLVSLFLFSIILVASMGTLLTLIDANAKAQALHTATTNLSFALDSMTRELRMGYHYYCFGSNSIPSQVLPSVSATFHNCSGGDTAIGFYREKNGVQMGYRYNSTNSTIEQKTFGGNWEDITSPTDVTITSFELVVENSEPYYPLKNDTTQPNIDVQVTGYVNNGLDTDTDFNVQTHIVQRRLDLI